uniref:Uncharacterized protein n=1 Tax=Arundo donax TaxID=35708 RepID=A0A0A8Z3H4_ARUDO
MPSSSSKNTILQKIRSSSPSTRSWPYSRNEPRRILQRTQRHALYLHDRQRPTTSHLTTPPLATPPPTVPPPLL